jgi:O-methyltransferase
VHIHQNLITKYPLISEQVSKLQVEVILRELTRVLDAGVEGDIVEFGCYIGTTSLFIRRLLDNQQTASVKGRSFHAPEFHVYDSFEGLPEKSVWDPYLTQPHH